MKRVVVAVIALVLLVIALASCRSTYDCPAYGETHKYQVEQRY